MVNVSENFKTAMKQPIKEIQAFIDHDESAIRDSDDLISYKVSCDSGLCKTAMRKLEANFLGNHDLLGKWVKCGFGVRLPDGEFEYLNFGSFLVTEFTTSKDTETSSIVAYDLMVKTMTPYIKLEIEYPINLYDYTKALCEACGIELGNETLPILNDWLITQELWENIEGITYRDIFVQIAQATASTCIIGADDKLYFKPLTDTGERLTYDNMFKLKLEAVYGEINSVVLSRTPSEDNIFLQDEASVQTNGLTEFKIENNEIIDKDRENAITPIFDILKGVYYYPFEATTEGLGWYEIGDNITIIEVTNDGLEREFKTSIFNYAITIDGSVKETLKTTAETKPQTQYQYATTLSKRVKNTEVIVNKQDQYIKQLVSDMYDENGVVNEKYTSIYQDIENIIASVQNSGGSNLIQNSVMFAYESEDNVANWSITGEGTITINSDTNALQKGGVSGHSFMLLDKTATQVIPVTVHTEDVEVYYSFSTRVKKDVTGNCYVKLYNSTEEYTVVSLIEGESADYVEYELTGLLPKENYYIVEFYGSADSNATFTDNMFAVGEYKAQWSQANGEVMNTQVNINLDGVTIKSSVYLGDYTAITPLEFAGYSNVSGTTTKVFSLNRDVTYIRKLLADEEIAMPPIKVVAITEGELQGWAFVPYVKEVE